ncbi:MAG: leucine--tRNA ligase [Firmicutes bacterium]|nr:leucine--tRNA ligase [Bacillota bacterium]
MNYPQIHDKWRKFWQDNNINKFNPNDKGKKYYTLEMLPYPSGASLHLGHFFNFAPSDTHARFKRMCGFNVFHPMGFDSFGLPSENHALKTNTHPEDNTNKNIEKFISQLEQLGGMYDWDYSFSTHDVDYYKWTQWLFIELFNCGLAYQKDAAVNWCGDCQTVLSNEQSQGGVCERCDSEVERKQMKQWFFKITDYAEELLKGLDKIDWPNKTKAMQRNWIGKSEGAIITYPTNACDIQVFTTRVDTIFGATFIVIAPEHPIVQKVTTKDRKPDVDAYISAAAKKSDIERMENHEKTGVFTGGYAINPASNLPVPIYVADYVLYTYGTGAVMGVPGHDARDHEFATKYGIEIKKVIQNNDTNEFTEEYGTLINSNQYNGLSSEVALKTITNDLKKKKLGFLKTTYRLRDWSIGRQRYWGVPIPIVYCDKCGVVPVPMSDLPVTLPYLQDFKPRGNAPLSNDENFVNCKCPTCGINAKHETETMDTFVCSSWYFLRYMFAKRDDVAFDVEMTNKWLPVDKYIGGAEHSCGHLLYSRFITKVLKKLGHVKFDEPFSSLVHQGMILAPDGQKMSKSKNNTISPDKYIEEFGSDILRLYMLFGFNYIDGGPWNDGTLRTITKFPERVMRLIEKIGTDKETDNNVQHVRATTIKAVREDLDSFSFNTAVARCMEFANAITGAKIVSRESVRDLVLLLAPMIPHIAEELYSKIYPNKIQSIFNQKFPKPIAKHLEKSTIEIVVQINSKIKERITIKTDATQDEVMKLCANILEGQTPKKVIYVQNKLINFII